MVNINQPIDLWIPILPKVVGGYKWRNAWLYPLILGPGKTPISFIHGTTSLCGCIANPYTFRKLKHKGIIIYAYPVLKKHFIHRLYISRKLY
jgi:hypothetical protein